MTRAALVLSLAVVLALFAPASGQEPSGKPKLSPVRTTKTLPFGPMRIPHGLVCVRRVGVPESAHRPSRSPLWPSYART